MKKQKIKKACGRFTALWLVAALLFTTILAGLPSRQAEAAEDKLPMDEGAYRKLGFDIAAEGGSAEGYLGPGNMVRNPQNELYFDFNGSSNYGYVLRDNLVMPSDDHNNHLKKSGAYERYGQYKNGSWANLSPNYGYTEGSLGGDTLVKGLNNSGGHQTRVYAVSTEFKSASGRDDRIAQIYVKSHKNRWQFQAKLEILRFRDGYAPSCVSTVTLWDQSPGALTQAAKWYNEQFDALFEITAGDYDGDGVDEVAVYCANNEVKIYKTTNDRLSLWQTIGEKELSASTNISKTGILDGKNADIQMAATVSLASGDLKKDYTQDLAIGVSMPVLSDNDKKTVNKNNRAFIYGFDAAKKKLVKDNTVDLNKIKVNGNDDDSKAEPMQAVNVAIGDLTGNGHQELVIGGRVGGSLNTKNTSNSGGKIGVIHVEYDFGSKRYEDSGVQVMEDANDNLRDKSLAGPGYRAPIGLAICNFGKINEDMKRLFLFDRLYSYSDGVFKDAEQKLYYSMDQRNNANENASKDAVWISKVLCGNFTGAKDASKQLMALVGVKEKGQDKYWYQACFISCENNTWHTCWEGIINQATSYNNRTDDTSKASVYVALSMPDVDDDSMLLRYLGSETFYTKPEVQAVLQASPYFQDVADTYDNYLNEGTTAYGTSKGSGKSVTAGIEAGLGMYTSGEVSFFAEGEFELEISASTSYEHEESKEVSTSVEYAVSGGDDYAVLFTIPYTRYWYECKDQNGKMQKLSIEEPMTPSTVVVPIEAYDAMAELYQGLEPIGGNLLKSVPGEPSTYTSTFQGERYTRIGEKQRLSNAGANSSSAVTVSREVSTTHDNSVSFSVEENMKVGAGAGFLGTGAVAGVTQSLTASTGFVYSKMNGVTYEGTVDNLPAGVSDYGFSWQFGAREAKLNDESVVIIGYETSDVKEPPKVPQNLAITEIGSRDMVLEWDVSAGAAVYELMLITNNGMELPQASIPSTQENADGTITYKVSDLTPSTHYSYTVTAINSTGIRSLPGAGVSGTTLSENQAGFKITEQPRDTEVSIGKTAEFMVETENETNKALNYRWQTYDASAKGWSYISGEYGRALSVVGEKDKDGSKYRCVVYTGGTMLISSAASLTIGRSASSVELMIQKEEQQVKDNTIVQASGTRTEREKVGEVDVPYTVTVQKNDKTYTKLSNSEGTVLWKLPGDGSNQYYKDADGNPAEECSVSDQIIFVRQEETEGETTTPEEIRTESVLTEGLPTDITIPQGVPGSKEDGLIGGHKVVGKENEYVFVASGASDTGTSDPDTGGQDAEKENRYFDKDGHELVMHDGIRYVKVGPDDNGWIDVADFVEVEDVRKEDIYENKAKPVDGDELTLTAEVKDANDKSPVTDQAPSFQIVNAVTGISTTVAANKGRSNTYAGTYTFQQSGIYRIMAVYEGSEQYTMSRSDSVTVIVKGSETEKQLFINGGSMTYGETMNLSPRIVDSAGGSMAVANLSYTVKRDGEELDVGETGILGSQFTPKTAGLYQITAEDAVNGVTASSEIKVSRRTLTITPASVEGSLADSEELRRKKLADTLSSKNTDEKGKVSVQGLVGADQITGYTLNSDAVAAREVGEYAIVAELDENSQNIKELSPKYTFVLNRGLYRLSQDRVLVKASADSNGSIRIRYQMDGSQAVEIESGTYIPKGAKLTVTAQPSVGFDLEKWIVNGEAEQDDAKEVYTVDSLSDDIELRAVFSYRYAKLEYNAAANGSIQGHYAGSGQIPFASGGKLNQNQSVILTAVPDDGYAIDRWEIQKEGHDLAILKAEDGTNNFTGTTYQVSGLKEDTAINVYFKAKEEKAITLSFKDRAGGTDAFTLGTSLSVNGESVKEENRKYVYKSFNGDNLTLDIAVPDNMLVDHWALVNSDGTETTAAGSVKQVKVYNLAQDLDYIVYCSIPNTSEIEYSGILDNTHGNGGTIEEAGTITAEGAAMSPVTCPQGTEITLTATPEEGYVIRKWTVNGAEAPKGSIAEKDDGSQVYRMAVNADSSVQVYFEKKPDIAWTADAEKGSVLCMVDGSEFANGSAAEFGSGAEWTITPNKGFEIAQAVLNGEDITEELSANSSQKDIRSYQVEDVQKNQQLDVTFRELATHTIHYSVAGLNNSGEGGHGSIKALAQRLGLSAYREEKEAMTIGEITVYEHGEALFTPVPESKEYKVTECLVNGKDYSMREDGTILFTAEQLAQLDPVVDLTVKFGASKPSDPSGPSDPSNPSDPSKPSDPSNPSDPSKPSDPSNPSDPSKPSDPSNPSDPSKPSDPSNPSDPSGPNDPSKPTGSVIMIDKATVKVANGETFVYNGQEQLPKQVIVTLNGAVLTQKDYDITYSAHKNAGTVQMTVSGKGAYKGTAKGSYQIKTRPLTIAANPLSKNYGEADPELTYQADGLVPGDTVKVVLSRQAGENPGSYKISVKAKANSNYKLTCKGAAFTIKDSKLPPSAIHSLNVGLRIGQKGAGLIVRWGRVSVADGYDIFAEKCGKSFPKKPTATVKGAAKTQVTIKKISGKRCNFANSYKVTIKPYRMQDGKKKYIASSNSLHYAGKNNKKLTNVKKITVKKKKITLKKGKTATVSVKLTKEKKGKALIMHDTAAGKGVYFWSSNQKAASVTRKGKIKAVSKGTCAIYVMAENGLKAKVTVTVK